MQVLVRAKEDFDAITHKMKKGSEYRIPKEHLKTYGDKVEEIDGERAIKKAPETIRRTSKKTEQ